MCMYSVNKELQTNYSLYKTLYHISSALDDGTYIHIVYTKHYIISVLHSMIFYFTDIMVYIYYVHFYVFIKINYHYDQPLDLQSL